MKRIFALLFLSFAVVGASVVAHAEPESVNITSLAKVATSPAGDPQTEGLATDGNPATQFAFAAGNQGEGAVTFTFPTVRIVNKVRVLQTQNVYYSMAYRIVGDADGDGKFEIVLADVKKPSRVEWDELSFAPQKINALRFESVEGVSKGARASGR